MLVRDDSVCQILYAEVSMNFIFINPLCSSSSKASGTWRYILHLELEIIVAIKVLCGFEYIAKVCCSNTGLPTLQWQ
jgi:hypothetical protein